MKKIVGLLCLAAFAMPAATLAAGHGCDSVNFSKEVLAKFPNAKKACLGLSEKNGGIYVHYQAKVLYIEQDGLTVNMLDRKGHAISKVKFAPAPDLVVEVNGKDTKYADLQTGTTLDLYIEHARWGLYAKPDGRLLTIISQENL